MACDNNKLFEHFFYLNLSHEEILEARWDPCCVYFVECVIKCEIQRSSLIIQLIPLELHPL